MTATEPLYRHLSHGLLRTDRVAVSEGPRAERIYRSDTVTLRVRFHRAGVGVIIGRDHHIEASKEGARLTAERKLEIRRPSMAEYARHWQWIAGVGLATTAIGLVVGIAAPGPMTGVVFPIGITLLLVVAYAARSRALTSPTAR
jgi:hypothetical protein